MNILNLQDGDIIEMPSNFNLSATKVKNELATIHPNKTFTVMAESSIATHNPKEIKQSLTLEAVQTMLGLLNIPFKMGNLLKNGDLARMCHLQEMTIMGEAYSLSVDDSNFVMHSSRYLGLDGLGEITDGTVVKESQTEYAYDMCVKKGMLIHATRGTLYMDSRQEADLNLAFPPNSGDALFTAWNEVADGKRKSMVVHMAIVNGKVVIAPTTVNFYPATYVEEFTLYEPTECGNDINAQFDNLSMKMLGE